MHLKSSLSDKTCAPFRAVPRRAEPPIFQVFSHIFGSILLIFGSILLIFAVVGHFFENAKRGGGIRSVILRRRIIWCHSLVPFFYEQSCE